MAESKVRLSRRVEEDGYVSGYDVHLDGVRVGYVDRISYSEYRTPRHPGVTNVRLAVQGSAWEARWPNGRSVAGDPDDYRRVAVDTLLSAVARQAEEDQ